jgi:hypothetical protein
MTRLSLCLLACASVALAQAPTNDTCPGAIPVAEGLTAGTTLNATADGLLAGCTNILATYLDVWYTYTPGTTGIASATVFGTGTNRVGVATGSCGAFTWLGCPTLTTFNWSATAGTTYFIRVGKSAAPGAAFDLSIVNAQPAGETSATPTPLFDGINPNDPTGISGFGFTNVGAVTDAAPAGSTVCGAFGSAAYDVWFSYTAVNAGNYVFSTCTPPGFARGSFSDSSMQVYDSVLTQVGCSADVCTGATASNFMSEVSVGLAAGSYLIRLSGFSTSLPGVSASGQGSFYFTVTFVPPPLNDDCTAAEPVVDGVNPAVGTYTNTAATDDAGYSAAGCAAGAVGSKGVWFVYIANSTANYLASTCTPGGFTAGSLADSVVEVFDNCGATFTSIGCSDNACGNHAKASFAAIAGNAYWIRVSSKSTTLSGTFYVSIDEVPANDECAGAIAVGLGVNGPFSMTAASTSAGPAPTCQTTNFNDLWFSFTAPVTGTLKMDTCGSSIADTVLAVYDACGGVQLACDDDDLTASGPCATTATLQSYLTMPVVAGTTYLIRIGNFSSTTTGNYLLTLVYKFSFSITKPTANDVQLTDVAGTPGNVAFNAVTLTQGAFPNGWFYGVDIPFGEILNEANSGPPFLVVLDGTGGYSVTFNGIPFLGLTFYTVAVEFSLGGVFVQRTDAVAYTI